MGNIFDIIGPVMVGPSSPHTAGAVKIGNICRQLLGETPAKATIYLHGSFEATGKGHGTDRAVVAGLLGMRPDNLDIPKSFELAKEAGMEFTIEGKVIRSAHPNTVLMTLYGKDGRDITVQASSIGGGRIMVNKLGGIEVNFRAEQNTLIVNNEDTPGHVADVANALAQKQINIATLQLYRNERGGTAVMVIETDQVIPPKAIDWLLSLDGILGVTFLNVTGEKE